MKKILQTIIFVASFMLVMTPVTPVLAQGRSEDTPPSQSNVSEEISERIREKGEAARTRISERTQEINKEAETRVKKTAEERKKTCEDRKKGLETKLKRLRTNASKHHSRIVTYLEKITQYAEDNEISDPSITSALASATEAQETSDASVKALNDLSPTLKCESGVVANDIATFKAAAETARDDLRAFRKSVKDVFKAIKEVEENSSTEGTE